MTLIVGLKAKDCIVIAADSLTSLGEKIVNCKTQKLRKVAENAVTAGCGLARVLSNDWQTILRRFPIPSPGTAFTEIASQLNNFFNEIIGEVPKNNFGACQGGNTFLLAGYDAANSDLTLAKLTRLGDNRKFLDPKITSLASNQEYIEWIGDTASIEAYIEMKTALYVADMSQIDAINFAACAIMDGITASQTAGVQTIGGEFVSIALISANGVKFYQYPTEIRCMIVPPLNGSSPTTPNIPKTSTG